jgi:hypothetical protein
MQMLLELVKNKLLHNYINDNSTLLEKRHSIKQMISSLDLCQNDIITSSVLLLESIRGVTRRFGSGSLDY